MDAEDEVNYMELAAKFHVDREHELKKFMQKQADAVDDEEYAEYRSRASMSTSQTRQSTRRSVTLRGPSPWVRLMPLCPLPVTSS